MIVREFTRYDKHVIRETFEVKKPAIKIHQISSAGNIEDGMTTYGLGHDGKLYYWDNIDAEWFLDVLPKVDDLGIPNPDPFEKGDSNA